MEETPTISVCNSCEMPVVWTFAFPYAEYYCLLCGNKTGMMGGKTETPATEELKALKRLIEKVWKVLRADYTGSGNYRVSKCKKCDNEDHKHHFTKKKIERSKASILLIEKLAKN